MSLKYVFSCIVLFSCFLAGCADNPGVRMPRDGRALPELNFEQLAYKTKQEWGLGDQGVVALAKSNLPITTRSEYILGFDTDHEERIVELNAQEISQAEMWEFDGFHVFVAVGSNPNGERTIVDTVVIDDRSAELEKITAPPDSQVIPRQVEDGVLLGLMGDSLDSSEFWSIDKYGVDDVRERDLGWSQLQYFQAQAFEERGEEEKEVAEEDPGQTKMQKTQDVLPDIEDTKSPEDNAEKVEIDLSE